MAFLLSRLRCVSVTTTNMTLRTPYVIPLKTYFKKAVLTNAAPLEQLLEISVEFSEWLEEVSIKRWGLEVLNADFIRWTI